MARGIHKGDIQPRGFQQGQLGKNGDTPAALQIMGIQKRIPMVHPAHLPPHTGLVQHRFR